MPIISAAALYSMAAGKKASPEHPLRVYDKTGAQMLFNRGKTYLAIVDDDEWSASAIR